MSVCPLLVYPGKEKKAITLPNVCGAVTFGVNFGSRRHAMSMLSIAYSVYRRMREVMVVVAPVAAELQPSRVRAVPPMVEMRLNPSGSRGSCVAPSVDGWLTSTPPSAVPSAYSAFALAGVTWNGRKTSDTEPFAPAGWL